MPFGRCLELYLIDFGEEMERWIFDGLWMILNVMDDDFGIWCFVTVKGNPNNFWMSFGKCLSDCWSLEAKGFRFLEKRPKESFEFFLSFACVKICSLSQSLFLSAVLFSFPRVSFVSLLESNIRANIERDMRSCLGQNLAMGIFPFSCFIILHKIKHKLSLSQSNEFLDFQNNNQCAQGWINEALKLSFPPSNSDSNSKIMAAKLNFEHIFSLSCPLSSLVTLSSTKFHATGAKWKITQHTTTLMLEY